MKIALNRLWFFYQLALFSLLLLPISSDALMLARSIPNSCLEQMIKQPALIKIKLDQAYPESQTLFSPTLSHYRGIKKLILNTVTPNRLVRIVTRLVAKSWDELQDSTVNEILSAIEPHTDYNIVLIDDSLYLSHTGSSSLRDLISKHIVLSELKNVHFAGKLWKTENAIHISNDTGSYRTDLSTTISVAKYLQAQLSTPVKAHAYNNP